MVDEIHLHDKRDLFCGLSDGQNRDLSILPSWPFGRVADYRDIPSFLGVHEKKGPTTIFHNLVSSFRSGLYHQAILLKLLETPPETGKLDEIAYACRLVHRLVHGSPKLHLSFESNFLYPLGRGTARPSLSSWKMSITRCIYRYYR